MREIKCRFWNKELHRWSYGFPCVFPIERDGITSRFDITDGFDIVFYTSLKDKNGKEIYEGDIVELYKYQGEALYCVTLVTTVKWNETGLNFNIWKPHENELWKVIGNIYENPELLGS